MKNKYRREELRSLFREEAQRHIQELSKGLLELEGVPQNGTALEDVRRRVHTLKGSARMVGFDEVSDTAHAMEDLLESVKAEQSELDKGIFDEIFRSLDSISTLLQTDDEDETTTKDADFLEAEGDSPGTPTETESSTPRYAKNAAQDTILVKTDKLDSLAGIISEVVLDQIRSENQMNEMLQTANLMKEQYELWLQLRDNMSLTLDGDWVSAEEQGQTVQNRATEHGLQVEEVNRYGNLSMSIRDGMTDLLDKYKQTNIHRRLLVGQLQDDIRSIRLVPLSAIFDTFPRAVRDLARKHNREIKLEISGGGVELDKSIIETIKDPLMHLVRNAVDHGIEAPEERLRQGKPRTGYISFSAYRRGSRVVIEVSDDGAGIDIEKVKQAALRRGYVNESQIQAMDDESATQLIFMSGLSTSSIITDMSGRGVGMDVVMETISRELKGMVDVNTELGTGTKISLIVPITLAIMRGLLVKAGQEIFAIPTESIDKNVKVPLNQIRYVEGKQVIVESERIIPLIKLSEVLGPNGTSAQDNVNTVPVVIVDHPQRQIGFCVDDFVGEQEIVIRSLGSYLKRVPNVAGVTVLGNGEVVAILNVLDLVDSTRSRHVAALPVQEPEMDGKVAPVPSILIVDDSLTTRELERSILAASGYDVYTAVDGLDGFNKVSERKFDLIISDVQMPRLDGFSMVEKIKQNAAHKDIPVIMVTSLQKDEEKRRGVEVGASAYIVKSSFDQQALLDTIQMLIG